MGGEEFTVRRDVCQLDADQAVKVTQLGGTSHTRRRAPQLIRSSHLRPVTTGPEQ
jgi:hypothetical protein